MALPSPTALRRRERRAGGIGANLTARSAPRSGSGVAQNARDGTPLRFVPDDERLKFAHMGLEGVDVESDGGEEERERGELCETLRRHVGLSYRCIPALAL